MTSNRRNLSHIPKPLICIYTDQNRKEFAIGLEKDENFRAITKVGESYTRTKKIVLIAFRSSILGRPAFFFFFLRIDGDSTAMILSQTTSGMQ
ncbi:MAG: hypothetical protein WA395_00835 [Nitrososphaeraceae archaeon]